MDVEGPALRRPNGASPQLGSRETPVPRRRDRWGNLGRAALRRRGVRGPLLLSGRTCARFLICPTPAGPLPAHQSPREDFRKRIAALRPRPAGSREERAPRKFRGLAAGALRGPCLPGGRGGAGGEGGAPSGAGPAVRGGAGGEGGAGPAGSEPRPRPAHSRALLRSLAPRKTLRRFKNGTSSA